MRVIAGKAKGVPLRAPDYKGTRPISDRSKEALFSILAPRLSGCRFLDLFAGTGGVGIEALSRGAREAVFVELAHPAIKNLSFNLNKTRLADHAKVIQADVFEYLARPPEPFDILFVAPPQWLELWQPAMRRLDTAPGWLAEDAIVVTQHDPREDEELPMRHLRRYQARRYGGVQFVFYEDSRA